MSTRCRVVALLSLLHIRLLLPRLGTEHVFDFANTAEVEPCACEDNEEVEAYVDD
jgi:hypothetical protein